jgi:hypothetical protein
LIPAKSGVSRECQEVDREVSIWNGKLLISTVKKAGGVKGDKEEK